MIITSRRLDIGNIDIMIPQLIYDIYNTEIINIKKENLEIITDTFNLKKFKIKNIPDECIPIDAVRKIITTDKPISECRENITYKLYDKENNKYVNYVTGYINPGSYDKMIFGCVEKTEYNEIRTGRYIIELDEINGYNTINMECKTCREIKPFLHKFKFKDIDDNGNFTRSTIAEMISFMFMLRITDIKYKTIIFNDIITPFNISKKFKKIPEEPVFMINSILNSLDRFLLYTINTKEISDNNDKYMGPVYIDDTELPLYVRFMDSYPIEYNSKWVTDITSKIKNMSAFSLKGGEFITYRFNERNGTYTITNKYKINKAINVYSIEDDNTIFYNARLSNELIYFIINNLINKEEFIKSLKISNYKNKKNKEKYNEDDIYNYIQEMVYVKYRYEKENNKILDNDEYKKCIENIKLKILEKIKYVFYDKASIFNNTHNITNIRFTDNIFIEKDLFIEHNIETLHKLYEYRYINTLSQLYENINLLPQGTNRNYLKSSLNTIIINRYIYEIMKAILKCGEFDDNDIIMVTDTKEAKDGITTKS